MGGLFRRCGGPVYGNLERGHQRQNFNTPGLTLRLSDAVNLCEGLQCLWALPCERVHLIVGEEDIGRLPVEPCTVVSPLPQGVEDLTFLGSQLGRFMCALRAR